MTFSIAKKLVASLLATVAAISITPASSNAKTNTTPPIGRWSWCTSSTEVGCMASVTMTSPQGVSTTYTSRPQTQYFADVVVSCDGVSPKSQSCDSNRYYTRSDGQCAEVAGWLNPYMNAALNVQVVGGASGGLANSLVGWGVRVVLNTGNFEPGYTIGHGITGTSTSVNADGTFQFTLDTKIELTYDAEPPAAVAPTSQARLKAYRDWLSTAVATSSRETLSLQVFPKEDLLNTSFMVNGCTFIPFTGAWAEGNGIGFAWNYTGGVPGEMSASDMVNPGAPTTFNFTAYGPHYLPQVSGQALQVQPARVQVFLPLAYFGALGYSNLSDFDSNSYSVTTSDGQVTHPITTIRPDGMLINVGIEHYSAPNPVLVFKLKGSPTSLGGYKAPKARKVNLGSKTLLQSIFKEKISSRDKWKAVGGCKISGRSLVAPKRRASCVVTLKVVNAKGKVTSQRSALVTVK